MFWKKKQSNPYQTEKIVTEVSLPTLARWYAYDAGLEDPNDIADALGMLPTSDEGIKLEEQESDRRVDRVVPLMPLLECIADINAQAVASLQFAYFTKEQGMSSADLEHERVHIEDMYRHVGFSALLAAFSAGIELGIVGTNAVGGQIVHVE